MRKYLILLLVTISTLATAQRPVKRFIENQSDSHINMLLNAGAENGTVGAIASVSTDLTIDTNEGYGTRSFKWSPAGISRNIVFSNGPSPQSLRGRSCLAKMEYAGTNFAAGEIVMRVEDNGTPITADLDLTPTATASLFRKAEIAFICPNTGTDLSIKLVNNASGKTIYADQLWLGSDYRLGIEPPIITEWKTFTPAWIGGGTISNQDWHWRRVGESMEIRGYVEWSGTGSGALVQLVIPEGKTADIPVTGASPNAGIVGNGGMYNLGVGAPFYSLEMYMHTATTVAFATQDLNSITGTEIGSGDFFNTTNINIPIVEWANSGTTQSVTLETQGKYFEGRITATSGNEALPVTDSDFFIPANTLLELDTSSSKNNLTCYIACQNETQTGTCSGAEVFGIACDLPYAGKWQFCASGSVEMIFDSTGDELQNTFVLSHTEVINSANEIASGLKKSRMGARQDSGTTNIRAVHNFDNCATFDMSAGQNKVVLKAAVASSTNPLNNTLFVDGSGGAGGFGERDLVFQVMPITQNFPQAVALPVDRWQKKAFPALGTTGVLTTFNNLIVGKQYELMFNAWLINAFGSDAVTGQIQIDAIHNASTILSVYGGVSNNTGAQRDSDGSSGKIIFVATATSLTVEVVSIGANLEVQANASRSFAILRELNHSQNVSDF